MIPALESVALLVKQQTLRIQVTESKGYTVKGPCLLAQLRDAVAVGMERGQGSSVPGAWAPISLDAFDLWVEINYNTHALARHLGLQRKDPHDHATTPWVGRLLRQCVAHAHSRGLERVADRAGFKAHQWAHQIGVMLADRPQEQRGVRGAVCIECGAGHVIDNRPDGEFRVPAIVLITRESLRWLVCQACGEHQGISEVDGELIFSTGEYDREDDVERAEGAK